MVDIDHYQALTSYQISAVLMAGVETGLFRFLNGSSATEAKITERLNLSETGTNALLGALVALGYVDKDDRNPANYHLSQTGRLFTETGSTGLARLTIKEAFFYQLWGRLSEVVRSGHALLPPFSERVKTDFPFVRTFLLALNDLAEKSSAGFLKTVSFDGIQSMIDVGGGAAGYATLIAKRYQDLRITLIDLAEVIPLARETVMQNKLADRIELLVGDCFALGFGIDRKEFDAVLLSHLLHDFSEPLCKEILQHALTAVRPGGRLIINDVFSETDSLKPNEAMFNLMMQVENPGGRSHPLRQVWEWLDEVGWGRISYCPLYFGGVIQASRPQEKRDLK